mmetsp:Transcript_2990/g.9973  ORF Transcript_2990/g.9973 Transcript_2990/m.9973 type:complete len:361 (-) Transcript_2990:155-1237(-)
METEERALRGQPPTGEFTRGWSGYATCTRPRHLRKGRLERAPRLRRRDPHPHHQGRTRSRNVRRIGRVAHCDGRVVRDLQWRGAVDARARRRRSRSHSPRGLAGRGPRLHALPVFRRLDAGLRDLPVRRPGRKCRRQVQAARLRVPSHRNFFRRARRRLRDNPLALPPERRHEAEDSRAVAAERRRPVRRRQTPPRRCDFSRGHGLRNYEPRPRQGPRRHHSRRPRQRLGGSCFRTASQPRSALLVHHQRRPLERTRDERTADRPEDTSLHPHPPLLAQDPALTHRAQLRLPSSFFSLRRRRRRRLLLPLFLPFVLTSLPCGAALRQSSSFASGCLLVRDTLTIPNPVALIADLVLLDCP